MDLGLGGTRALVTAASRGIGRACAAALAAEGARVFMVSRDRGRLEEAASAVGAEGSQVADLAEPAAPERVVAAAAAAFGGLDILVCNAGGPSPGTFESTDLASWDQACQLTLMSTVRLCHAALAHLKASGRGRLINITSISVRQPIPNLVLSNAFRAAVTGMAKTLAAEVAGAGVTVNNLAPGTILTDRVRALHGPRVEELAAAVPAGRLGEPAELGAACAFLCSRQAAYITGQTIGIDGGALRGVH